MTALILAAAAATADAAPPPRRIVLVTIDGIRAGGGEPPAWMALPGASAHRVAAASPHVFATTTALLTGRTPDSSGVVDDWSRGAPASGPAVALALGRAGYRAIALPGDPLFHSGSRIGRGFERFEARAPGWSDSARVDGALAWLAGGGRRMAWIGLGFEAPPPPWRRPDLRIPGDSAYQARAARIGRELERLERGLAALGGGHALVVVGIRAAGGAAPGADLPLVLRLPPGPAPGAHRVATLPDVAATLVDLGGGARAGFAGRSLLGRGGAAAAAPAAPRAAAASRCDSLLRSWIGRPPGPMDSTAYRAARALGVACPASPRHAIEEAVAVSQAGADDPAAHLFLQAQQRFAGDHRIALAYAEHLIRHRHRELVPNALGAIPADSPLAAEAAWREATAALNALDFADALRGVERAAALAMLPGLDDPRPAIRRLIEARARLDASPADYGTMVEYGRALGDAGLMDEAFSQLNQARFRDSTRTDADLEMARLLLRERRTLHASRALERAVRAAPAVVAIRRDLADLLAAGEEWRRAIPHYEAVVAAQPEDAVSRYNLACLRARSGESAAALDELERAVEAGYSDWDTIARDPDLDPLRADPRFSALRSRRR